MKPKRIILIRHGQSEGNADNKIYEKVPDFAIKLTDEGHRQAQEAGRKIREIVGDESIQFYYSPFQRTKETLAGLQESLKRPDGTDWPCVEEVRLREQEWGHLRDVETNQKIQEERDAYHTFYYRLPDGESGADVYDRVASFFSTLFRDFENRNFPTNVIIVTHGMSLRIFLMKWFHWTVDEFVQKRNPENCQFFVMERATHEAKGVSVGENGRELDLDQFIYYLDEKFTLLTPLENKDVRS